MKRPQWKTVFALAMIVAPWVWVASRYPDAQKFSYIGMEPPPNKFMGFDPLTQEQRWLYDQIEGAHSAYDSVTGV